MFTATAQFCGVFAYTQHTSIEFGRGCEFTDPYRVLEGSGKLRRHIKVHTRSDIVTKRVHTYIRQAYVNSCKK